MVYKQPVLMFNSDKKSAKRSIKSFSYNPLLLVFLLVCIIIIILNTKNLEFCLGF
jgi:hypothetical protein